MRRSVVILGASLVALVAGSYAIWFWATGWLEDQLRTWEEARAAEGWTIRHGAPVWSGWPGATNLTLPDWSVKTSTEASVVPLTFSAAALRLEGRLLRPRKVRLVPQGAMTLALGGSALHHITVGALAMTVTIAATPEAELSGTDVAIGPSGGADAQGGISLGDVSGQLTLAQPAGFSLATARVGVPPAVPTALGPRIDRVAMSGTVSNWPGPAPSLATRAAAWRDAGGSIALDAMTFSWGPLTGAGSGNIRLDDSLQPAGRGSLRLTGYRDALSALVEARAIPETTARAVGAVLGLMATQDTQSGSVPEVTLPLTLSDRTLRAGRIPLARLPFFQWSDSSAPASVRP